MGAYTYAGTGFANPHAPTTINGVSYSYDGAGNLLSAGTSNYTWNYRNRLISSNNGATSTIFTYDQSDQRVTQTKYTGGATTTTTYWNSYYETTGATKTLYIYALGQLVATVEGRKCH